jgi:hypothetical protein
MLKGIILNFIARIFALSRFFLFHSINVYSRQKKKLFFYYPAACVANHVSEFDVAVMLFVNRFTNSRYTVPARKDIFERNFLQKEFGASWAFGFFIKVS